MQLKLDIRLTLSKRRKASGRARVHETVLHEADAEVPAMPWPPAQTQLRLLDFLQNASHVGLKKCRSTQSNAAREADQKGNPISFSNPVFGGRAPAAHMEAFRRSP